MLEQRGYVEIVDVDSKYRNKMVDIYIKLFKIGHSAGCHQMKERSFSYKGWQFPVCARCTGILFGQIIGLILILLRIVFPFYVYLIFLGIMFLDWFIQFLKILKSNNLRRFITGSLAGISQVSLAYIVIKILIGLIF